MNAIFIFLHTYYQIYFYLIAGCTGICIMYFLLRARERKLSSVKRKCMILIGCFVMIFAVTVVMKNHLPVIKGVRHQYLVALGLKMVMSMMLGAAFVPFTIWLYDFVVRVVCSGVVQRNKYGIIIFIITVAHLVTNLPEYLDGWSMVWYATDYSMGMGSRFFIGTVLKLFYDDYLEPKVAYHFCLSVLIIIIALVSYLLNAVIMKSEATCRRAVTFIVLCFVAGPGYISAMWDPFIFGKLETYTFLLAMVSVIIFSVVKNLYVKYIIITLLSCITMAIYQGNLFMYYPIVLMLLIEDCISAHNGTYQRRWLGLVNVIATGASFCYFQFFSYTTYENAGEMAAAILKKSDVAVYETAIDLELFQPLQKAYDRLNKVFLAGIPREKAFTTSLLLLPIVVLAVAIYLKCREYRLAVKKGILSKPYVYFVLLNFAIVPQFLLNIDWGRWMLSVNIVLFFGILYLVYRKDKGMGQAIEALDNFISNHGFISVMMLVYLAAISKFTASFIPEINNIVEFFFN